MDVFSSVLAFMWLVYFWDTYLSSRQHKVYENVRKLPDELESVIDQTNFEKARNYALDRSSYGFWHGLYSQCESTFILCFNGIPLLWMLSGKLLESMGLSEDSEITHSLLFIVLGGVISTILSLPWSLYSTFVIEERHGFNKMTLGFYLKDLVKKFVVTQLITIPLISLIIYVIQIGGDYFFVYAWAMIFVFLLIIMHVYPEYIAPLFDKYTPLPDGELKSKIEELASSLKFPLKKLFVVEGSKRSAHSNAYLYGFHKNKRIVLYDTLLEDYSPVEKTEPESPKEDDKGDQAVGDETETAPQTKPEKKKIGCNNDEVVAILGHELGHWKFSHTLKQLAISQVSILFSFFLFGKLMNQSILFSAFGFVDVQPTLIKLLIVFSYIFSPINEVESVLVNLMTRRFEYQADEFSVGLGKRDNLKMALLKLFKDNSGFPVDDWLYSICHLSHPSLLERVRAMDRIKYKSE
uniref:CAAX prenyl protease n=1 Tax=Phallusia mammillata TaxID=59560 RepID=A0A6F9DYB6_9ASCI|nr:CAAX prenyl protease 1 homolog [Phallusia mammillata]